MLLRCVLMVDGHLWLVLALVARLVVGRSGQRSQPRHTAGARQILQMLQMLVAAVAALTISYYYYYYYYIVARYHES